MDSPTPADKFRSIQRAFQQIYPHMWEDVPAIGQPLLTYCHWMTAKTELGAMMTPPDFSRRPELPHYWATTKLPVGMFEQALRLERRQRNAELAEQARQRQARQAVPIQAPTVLWLPCLVLPAPPVCPVSVPRIPHLGYTQHQVAPRAQRPPRPTRKILPQRRN